MKNKTLVILAAGMSSRFGGIKQIEPVGNNQEIIADYSVFDAIRTGFNKVVFVIKKEHLNYFKENITCRYNKRIKVEFVFQTLNDKTIPKIRTKMLGTAHALLMAKDKVNEPFLMINADDFYGKKFFEGASLFLENNLIDNEYLSINCSLKETLSSNGLVNRGIVIEENNYIKDIIECSVESKDDYIIARNKTTNELVDINNNQAVAVNFFVFKPSIFNILENEYKEFIKIMDKDNEICLTEVLSKNILNKNINFKTMNVENSWIGMTYKEDLPKLKLRIKELTKKGDYPENLWK